MTSDSVVVGMKGAVGLKESAEEPTLVQEPLTAGAKEGMVASATMASENRTVTTWFDGTLMAPAAGTEDSTERGLGAATGCPPEPDRLAPARLPPPLCRPSVNAPMPTATTATITITTMTARRTGWGGSTRSLYSATGGGGPAQRRRRILSASAWQGAHDHVEGTHWALRCGVAVPVVG